MKVWVNALFVLCCLGLALTVQATERPAVTPKVGVLISAADIERARHLVQTTGWAAGEAQRIMSAAAQWMEYPDSWYYEMVPPQGSIFAYGQTGCPVDGTAWPNFGAREVADFSRPFILQCPTGHLIDIADPASPYYDEGDGVLIDGVRYYLRGVWNAYVTNQLAGQGNDAGAVHMLAYAYALTGEERYAHKAMVIMDALATLSPTTIGPRDFATQPHQQQGRLHWLTSIVFRSRIHLVNAYDLVYHGMVDQPSPTYPGRSMRENIEEGLFLDYVFGEYNMRDGRLSSLHNHEADSIRGLLAVGMLLGIPDYIKWGIDGIVKFFDNTIDRDGLYYETSFSYSISTQSFFLSMAELAYNYSPTNYEGEDFPARSDFPYNANFYDHPKLQKFLVGYRQRIDAAGFRPAIGDASPNLRRQYVTTPQLESAERIILEHFAARASDPQQRARFAALLQADSPGGLDQARAGRWLLFHAAPLPQVPGQAAEPLAVNAGSALLGGSGIGYLRSGEAPNLWVALLRGGSTLPHGHDDVLGLLLYGKGWDFNTEIGYGIHGTPVHRGWGSTGIAHNLVVVNKGLDRNYELLQVGPGGDTLAFAEGHGFAGVEMDAYQMFVPGDGVKQYQRGVWQIDVGAYDAYWIDLFRIQGGKTHDYSFHAGSSIVNFAGLQPQSVPDIWTLHGLDDPDASFDAPGRSWGERVIAGENIKDLGLPGERVISGRGWTPVPGNGYGFIHDLQAAAVEGAWSATWTLVDMAMTRLQLTMLPQGGAQQVYKGLGPDLSGNNKYAWVVGRREAETELNSRFVSVIQAYGGLRPVVRQIEELPFVKGDAQSVVLRLGLASAGRVDYVLSNPGPGLELSAAADGKELASDALFALVRMQDDRLLSMHMVGGTYLRYGSQQLQMAQDSYSGVIDRVDYGERCLLTTTPLPTQGLSGATVMISNPAYAKNTAYRVEAVRELAGGLYAIDLGQSALELGRSEIEQVAGGGRLQLKAPLPTGFAYSRDTQALHGKQVLNERTGTFGVVQSNPSMKSLQLTEPKADWQAHDSLLVYDVGGNDRFVILTQADALAEEGQWLVQGNGEVKMTDLE